MELQLSAEQEIFGDTTRKFLGEHMPVAGLRALRHDQAGFPPDYWRRGAGLGWTALLVSEQTLQDGSIRLQIAAGLPT